MWVRIESSFFSHPKAEGLDDHAVALFFRGLCRAGSHLTDGRLSASFVKGKRQAGVADRLVATGLWHRAKGLDRTCQRCWAALGGEPGDGWVIHDFLAYNFSKAEQERRREDARAIRVAGGQARAAGASRVGGRFAPAEPPAGDQQTTSGPAGDATSRSTSRPPAPVLSLPSLQTDTKETAFVNSEGLAQVAEMARSIGKPIPPVSSVEVEIEAGRRYKRRLERDELAPSNMPRPHIEVDA